MDDITIGLTLIGFALALAGFAWRTLQERQRLREKSADLMRSIIELSGTYLAVVDEAQSVVAVLARESNDPDTRTIAETIGMYLDVWRQMAEFNHSTGVQLFLHAIEMGKVDFLLKAHDVSLVSVARVTELLATPNLTYARWAVAAPDPPFFGEGKE